MVSGKAHVVDEPDVTPQASLTFWDRVVGALLEARALAATTPGTVVAASIIVMDDDAEILREWELGGEP